MHVEYKFDLKDDCPQCDNFADQIRMVTIDDDTGEEVKEWHQCRKCQAVCQVLKGESMTLEELDAYLKREDEIEDNIWREKNK